MIKNANTITTEETSVVIKNVRLDARKLLADKVTFLNSVTREVNPNGKPGSILSNKEITSSVEELVFPLKKISSEQLKKLRETRIPSFILKEEGSLYFAKIEKEMNLVSTLLCGVHKCSSCRFLSAATDEEGGCAKVRNHSYFIERYKWIEVGYETFNTNRDAFVVAVCNHYGKFPPKKKRTTEEVNALKLGLAQYMWPDVESLAESRHRYSSH